MIANMLAALVVVFFAAWLTVMFRRRLLRTSARCAPVRVERRIVVIDGHGPIIGTPTRHQWRLRRRALQEAEEICARLQNETSPYIFGEEAHHTLTLARSRIRERIHWYDGQSPEFSGVAMPRALRDSGRKSA